MIGVRKSCSVSEDSSYSGPAFSKLGALVRSHAAEHSLDTAVPSPTLRCPSLLYVDFSNSEIGVSRAIRSRGTRGGLSPRSRPAIGCACEEQRAKPSLSTVYRTKVRHPVRHLWAPDQNDKGR